NADMTIATRARNVISDNRGAGIEISGLSTNTTVQGNFIGTDAAGNTPLGNGIGVFLNDAVDNTIGGMTAAARNVISGNRNVGILRTSLDSMADNNNWVFSNQIENNLIGVRLNASALTAVFDNDITRNIGFGVSIEGILASFNFVQANRIIANVGNYQARSGS